MLISYKPFNLKLVRTLISTLTLSTLILSHMFVKQPYPRRSKFSLDYQRANLVDWDLSAPIGRDTELFLPFPCRGVSAGPIQAKYKAGDTVEFQFTNQTYHRGGHCQFSISYDDGNTFGVLLTVLRTCFIDSLNYKVQLPENLIPSEKVVLSWTWVNASGLREFYMNCIDVSISNPNNSQKLTLPKMLLVNYPGYPTIPEFYATSEDYRHLYQNQPNVSIG